MYGFIITKNILSLGTLFASTNASKEDLGEFYIVINSSRPARVSSASISTTFTNNEITTELFRKTIHMMVALVPLAASINILATEFLLTSAIVVYSICETIRLNGRSVVLVSRMTALASRSRDNGRFVMGPVTLATGALLALMLYPSTAAAVGIYALAFGDSAASLVGRFFGKIEIPGFGKKTLEGTFACFITVFIISYMMVVDAAASLIIAFSAAVAELIPVKDIDNILIPILTGIVAVIVI